MSFFRYDSVDKEEFLFYCPKCNDAVDVIDVCVRDVEHDISGRIVKTLFITLNCPLCNMQEILKLTLEEHPEYNSQCATV